VSLELKKSRKNGIMSNEKPPVKPANIIRLE
jgi:hypothetical protein